MASARYEFLNTGERSARVFAFPIRGISVINTTNQIATVYDGFGTPLASVQPRNIVQLPIRMAVSLAWQLAAPATGIATVEAFDYPVEAKTSGVTGPVNTSGENTTEEVVLNNSFVDITLMRPSNIISIYFTNTIASRGQLDVTATMNGISLPIFQNLHLEVVSSTSALTRQLFMPEGTVIRINYTGSATFVVQY